MRSAGLVCLDEAGNLLDKLLIVTSKESCDGIDLLRYVGTEILQFMDNNEPSAFIIENLAFNAKSGTKDLTAGLWWHVKYKVQSAYPHVLYGTMPVQSWRNKTIDLKKENKQRLQEKYGKKYLKEGVLAELPPEVRDEFDQYISLTEFPKGVSRQRRLDSVYDLSDAYFMGQRRLELGEI
jgi:hypothetical protein